MATLVLVHGGSVTSRSWDPLIPPDHALQMAANAGAETVLDIDADHDVAGSAPQELARILDRIAVSVAVSR